MCFVLSGGNMGWNKKKNQNNTWGLENEQGLEGETEGFEPRKYHVSFVKRVTCNE